MEQVQDPLALVNLRPRFTTTSGFAPSQLKEKILIALQDEQASCNGNAYDRYAAIFLPPEQQHFWSPMLRVSYELDELDENLTEVRGLYGPKPAIWTLFAFCYFGLSVAGVFALIWGYSNYSLGKSAVILWFVPIIMLLIGVLYLVSYLGRKKSKYQMLILHDFFTKATGIKV